MSLEHDTGLVGEATILRLCERDFVPFPELERRNGCIQALTLYYDVAVRMSKGISTPV